MAITYHMRGYDIGASDFVYWTSVGTPEINPTLTNPSLIGSLTNVCILDEEGSDSVISVSSYTFNESTVGTIPTIIGSIRLAAGTYPAPSAEIGAGNPLYAATLELRKPDGTVLATIGGTAGGLAWRTALTGFTLTATTDCDLVLFCNTALEPVFIKGLTF